LKNEIKELQLEKDESTRARISFPEAFIVISIAAIADALELLTLIPYVGWVLGLLIVPFGYMVTGGIFMWSFLRHASLSRKLSKKVAQKSLPIALGGILDAATISTIPLRTLTVILVIAISNHVENKNIKRLEGLLKSLHIG